MPVIISGDTGITTPTYGGTDTSEYLVPVTAFKNRIINGAMMIAQRGTSALTVTNASSFFGVDRFYAYQNIASSKFTVQQNAGSVTPPAGFINYLGATSSSAYSVTSTDQFKIVQVIEGFNTADLAWGTANAQTVTLSFWVRSSLTGTFGGSLQNGTYARSYPFSYTISSANTWEQKTVTIAGDTTGTWATDNSASIILSFSLGAGSTNSSTAGSWTAGAYMSATGATSVVGTNGATFYITGVQLEKGSTATSFDYRPYGTELALCQRYYYRISNNSANSLASFATGVVAAATQIDRAYSALPVTMRSAPTIGINSLRNYDGVTASAVTSVGSNFSTTTVGSASFVNSGGGLGVGRQGMVIENTSSAYLEFSAEL